MPTLAIFYPPYTRYDKANNHQPFSGAAGRMFVHRTVDLIPGLTYQVYPFVPAAPSTIGADYALILGSTQAKILLGAADINPVRGYRKTLCSKPAIVTYSHLDCWEFSTDDEDGDDESDAGDSGKDIAVTRKSNYLFWALADFKKLFRPAVKHAARQTLIAPPISLITDLLTRAPAGMAISIDIETRVQDNSLDCIGLSFLTPDNKSFDYVIPIYDYTNALHYSPKETATFWRALYLALLRPDVTWVGHNLAFDFSILFHYYSLPFPRRIHDTMLFMHRENPFVDKSLAHAISYYTDSSVCHKGNFVPNLSAVHQHQLLSYNADDVYWTGEVYRRQIATTDESLKIAARQAFDSQYLCHIMGFTGVVVSNDKLEARVSELNIHEAQLLRVIRLLTNDDTFNPNSPKQLAAYFYGKLDYEPPEFTDTNEPSTSKTSLLKLQLKQPNPLIPIILEYKKISKELSMLGFTSYETHKI